MQYALLIYGRPAEPQGPISDPIAAILARPSVGGWARLHADESATTLRAQPEGRTIVTDGPFIDSKEYLAGLIMVEAANLDEALAIAQDFQDTRTSGAIEIRPVVESGFRGA